MKYAQVAKIILKSVTPQFQVVTCLKYEYLMKKTSQKVKN